MILFNFTGLNRVYWLPMFQHQNDGARLWYATLRWLGIEVHIYSRLMGSVVIQMFGNAVQEMGDATEKMEAENV